MSLIESIPGASDFISKIQDAVFGENNSRIDMVLDYFFNLRQEKRAKIVLYSIFAIISSMLMVMGLYFWGLHRLQNQLDNATDNIKELNLLQPEYNSVTVEFNNLLEQLKSNNQYPAIVSKLDQKNKDFGVDTTTLPEKPPLNDLRGTDPMTGQFQQVKIEYKINSISLKKIIEYVAEIQKMPNHFEFTNFEIHQKFGTKLYFDVNVTLEAYVPSAVGK